MLTLLVHSVKVTFGGTVYMELPRIGPRLQARAVTSNSSSAAAMDRLVVQCLMAIFFLTLVFPVVVTPSEFLFHHLANPYVYVDFHFTARAKW